MLTQSCQRWRNKRDSYRPAGETIDTRAYEVALIESDKTARTFVETHHYSGSYPPARLRAGLYRRGELVGVAVLTPGASQAAMDSALPFPDAVRAELGRFVLLDDVPANGESWFLARAWELAGRAGIDAVVSHSDPQPRMTQEGRQLFPGHVGPIYQATNAVYVGLTARRTRRLYLDNSGVFDGVTASKLRRRVKGWEYAAAQLVARGAPEPTSDWDGWCKLAVNATTRPVRHTGSYRYLFALNKRLKKHLPASLPYPKVTLA